MYTFRDFVNIGETVYIRAWEEEEKGERKVRSGKYGVGGGEAYREWFMNRNALCVLARGMV